MTYLSNMFEADGDMGIYDVPSWISDFEPKRALRELKILMITTDDIKFSVSPERLDVYKPELDFLKINCPDDVITGSFALNLYNLINRDTNDIDILIKDKNRYSYYNDEQGYGDVGLSENRLGYKYHIHRKEVKINNNFLQSLLFPIIHTINTLIRFFGNEYNFKVDYFIDEGVRFNTFEYKGHTYKIHCPIQIMEQKLDMFLNDSNNTHIHLKHKKDLFVVFKQIQFDQFKKGNKIELI